MFACHLNFEPAPLEKLEPWRRVRIFELDVVSLAAFLFACLLAAYADLAGGDVRYAVGAEVCDPNLAL